MWSSFSKRVPYFVSRSCGLFWDPRIIENLNGNADFFFHAFHGVYFAEILLVVGNPHTIHFRWKKLAVKVEVQYLSSLCDIHSVSNYESYHADSGMSEWCTSRESFRSTSTLNMSMPPQRTPVKYSSFQSTVQHCASHKLRSAQLENRNFLLI